MVISFCLCFCSLCYPLCVCARELGCVLARFCGGVVLVSSELPFGFRAWAVLASRG